MTLTLTEYNPEKAKKERELELKKRRKQIAILLMSTTLTDHAVEEIAGYMVGLADNLNDGEDDIGLQ